MTAAPKGSAVMEKRGLIPEKYKCLSDSVLKLLALISMLVDHAAVAFLRNGSPILLSIGSHTLTLYRAMRFFGRLAFPLYCFLLTEGFFHTRDRRRYALRLGIFAVLSELPWNLFRAGTLTCTDQNVFFTLLLGFLGIWAAEAFMAAERGRLKYAAALLGLLVMSLVLRGDYGAAGFGFILMLWALRERPLVRAAVGCCLLPSQWKAGLAFIPIGLYNGERGFIRGRIAGLVFYAIYPLHLLAFALLRIHMT